MSFKRYLFPTAIGAGVLLLLLVATVTVPGTGSSAVTDCGEAEAAPHDVGRIMPPVAIWPPL